MPQIWMWVGFTAAVLGMLALDLGVFHRTAHAVSVKEAASWSVAWVVLALLFALGVHRVLGPEAGLEFLTGYLIEKSLSVDNIFVFVLIFSYFGVPLQYQHRVLFWGVLGALVMRGIMIAAGAMLLDRFHWIIYVFGAFLVFTGVRMARAGGHDIAPEANPVIRAVRRLMPVTEGYRGARFFVREAPPGARTARWAATPLFLTLVFVETTDLVFAVDSIPAIFAVTDDPFIVYTSNVFAILGLRSLYFLLAGVIDRFRFLRLGLAAILVFVGAKMLLAEVVHVPIALSLGVIVVVLGAAVAASLLLPVPDDARGTPRSRRPPRPGPGAAA